MPTIITPLDMATKGCSPTKFDRAHDATLGATKVRVMGLTISFAVMAKNIRHLQFERHGARV
jgi:hypothetical protein